MATSYEQGYNDRIQHPGYTPEMAADDVPCRQWLHEYTLGEPNGAGIRFPVLRKVANSHFDFAEYTRGWQDASRDFADIGHTLGRL